MVPSTCRVHGWRRCTRMTIEGTCDKAQLWSGCDLMAFIYIYCHSVILLLDIFVPWLLGVYDGIPCTLAFWVRFCAKTIVKCWFFKRHRVRELEFCLMPTFFLNDIRVWIFQYTFTHFLPGIFESLSVHFYVY